MLSFTREWFRAYEKSASDGGSTVQTSEPGVWTLEPNQYLLPDFMNRSGNHYHDTTMDSGGTHNHGIEHGTTLLTDTGSVVWEQSGYHDHVLHNPLTGDHAHSMYSVSHNHAVDLPNHIHGLVFGIYEGTAPTGVTIKLDNVDLTTALGGVFNENKTDLDLSSYVTSIGWHTLEIGSKTLGRINASLFIQLFMHM